MFSFPSSHRSSQPSLIFLLFLSFSLFSLSPIFLSSSPPNPSFLDFFPDRAKLSSCVASPPSFSFSFFHSFSFHPFSFSTSQFFSTIHFFSFSNRTGQRIPIQGGQTRSRRGEESFSLQKSFFFSEVLLLSNPGKKIG